MPLNLNTAISALDTPTSLLPFFIKDSFDITGRTVMAQTEGGKHEAREKFIEEAGTSLFWIGGIPGARALINYIYKGKIDSDIQFKRINTEGIQSYFADKLEETAEGSSVKTPKFSKQDLEGIVLDGGKLSDIQGKLSRNGFLPNITKGFYKKYNVGVTAAAVLINLVMLTIAVPQFNQFLSRRIISKEVKKTGLNQECCVQNGDGVSFKGFKDLLDFKSLFNFTQMAENAQMNPVNAMLLLDYGISGSRVTITPRNNNERVENFVKEGGIIFFFYFAADIIKNWICKFTDKAFNVPIDLDYKILNCKEFADKLKNPHNKEELLDFVSLEKDDAKAELKVIKMIDQQLANVSKDTPQDEIFKNFTLKMAHKEGLIQLEYDEKLQQWIRHSKKFIQTDKVIALNENLRNFYEKAVAQIGKHSSKLSIEEIIQKTKRVKIFSIFANIAICCASLSFIVPKIQYLIREHRTQTKKAPGVKLYQEMAERNLI